MVMKILILIQKYIFIFPVDHQCIIFKLSTGCVRAAKGNAAYRNAAKRNGMHASSVNMFNNRINKYLVKNIYT